MNLLELDNVELSFGKNEILKSIYFKAEKGAVTGILGSNGCGKTSLLKILFGILKPNNKLIRIDHKPVLKPLYTSGKIHYLPQFHYVPESMRIKTVFDHHKVSFGKFVELFPTFHGRGKSNFNQLSGGEKRLIEVYTSIHSQADIILLDEPFSYLAPIYNEILQQEITKVKSEKCLIITDHFYEKILEVSDDLYLITEGYSKKIDDVKDLVRYNYLRSL